MKRIIIGFSLSLIFLMGCTTIPNTTEEVDNTKICFTKVNDIPYPQKIVTGKMQMTSIAQTIEENLIEDEIVEEVIEEINYNDSDINYNYNVNYDYDINYDYNTNYDYNGTYYADYSELYNTDGPSRTMPGWYDGYLETYYNASSHYLAETWVLDNEGFYHDGNGRYVVGVNINEINPETGEKYQYGDIVSTGKGEGVVYDYGYGAHVHDFATTW